MIEEENINPEEQNEEEFEEGQDMPLGPGQEQHLPHEAWHEVQQRRPRPRPIINEGEEDNNDE